jgi:hypothetical protein
MAAQDIRMTACSDRRLSFPGNAAGLVHSIVEKAVDKPVDKYCKSSIDRILFRLARGVGKKHIAISICCMDLHNFHHLFASWGKILTARKKCAN